MKGNYAKATSPPSPRVADGPRFSDLRQPSEIELQEPKRTKIEGGDGSKVGPEKKGSEERRCPQGQGRHRQKIGPKSRALNNTNTLAQCWGAELNVYPALMGDLGIIAVDYYRERSSS